MPKAAAAIGSMADQARDAGISFDEYQEGQIDRLANFVEGAAEAGQDLETLLAASASGMEGPGAELATILQGMGKQFTDYMDEDGNFNKEKLREDLKAAKQETSTRDELVEGLTQFQSTLREIKEAIEKHIIGPIGKAIGPHLTRLSDLFKTANDKHLKPAITAIGDIIQKFTSDISNFGFKTALSNLLTDIGKAAKPVFDSMINSIKAMLFGQSVDDVLTRLKTTKDSLTANAADIQSQIAALETQLPDLSGANADAAKAQIKALTEQLGRVKISIDETSEEMENATGSSGLLGGVFGGLWDKVKEMDWTKIGIGVGAFTLALLALGKGATIVSPGLFAIGAAFAGIGLAGFGIAALIDSITGGVETLAIGLERMQKLDAEKLLNVGNNLGPLTSNLKDLAIGGIVASFIGEGTFENLAKGLAALAEVPGQLLSIIGDGIGELSKPLLNLAGSGIVLNFVGDNVFGNLADQLKKFEDLKPATLHQVGPALTALNQGIQAFTGSGIFEGMGKALGNFFGSMFGGNKFDDLIKDLKKFENLNTQKIYEVGQGLQGIANFSKINIADIEIGSKDLDRLNTVMSRLNPDSITTYNSALEELVKTLAKLNDEMLDFNSINAGTTGGAMPGTSIGMPGAVSNIGGSSDQQLTKLEQLNTTMMQVLSTLQEGTEYGRRTAKAVRANGNLQMGI
jgi:hypothetical protein